MKVKSTLRVINQADCKGRRGVTDGQTYQRLVGWPEVQGTDRVRLGRATYFMLKQQRAFDMERFFAT